MRTLQTVRIAITGVLAILLLACGPCYTATAQEGGADKAQAAGATPADINKLLTGLGYEPAKVNDTTWRIKLDRSKWSFRINVGISSNNKKVWLTTYLAEIPDIDKVPQGVLVKLLQANLDYGPAHFVLSDGDTKAKKWLKLQYAIENRGVTPVMIREELDYFASQLQESSALWDTTKWARLLTPSRIAVAKR